VDIKSFDCIQVGSFFVAVYYLNDFVRRAEGMRCIIKVFCKAVGLVFILEGSFVVSIPCGKSSTSLSDVSFFAIGAGMFVCSR
jgi:hypothetical protein